MSVLDSVLDKESHNDLRAGLRAKAIKIELAAASIRAIRRALENALYSWLKSLNNYKGRFG